MLSLATTIGDRIHRELAVYGANIIVYPKAEQLEVKVGGVDVKPSTGGAYLRESDLEKLKTIFWANNITGVSPQLNFSSKLAVLDANDSWQNQPHTPVVGTGFWFDHTFGSMTTGAGRMHPLWKIKGSWPRERSPREPCTGICPVGELAVGVKLAQQLKLIPTSYFVVLFNSHNLPLLFAVSGIASTGDSADSQVILTLADAQHFFASTDAVSRIEISARTKPEDAFARVDPDTLSPQKHEIWYCSPYANSIAYQIREAIPGAQAEQVRRVEQTEGTVLKRISGLMWLVSLAALLAAGFAVSAAMATAVLERRREIGLMRSLGASQSAIAGLFYAESAVLAAAAGTLGYIAGSLLAWTLGAHIFPGDGASAVFLPVLLPVVLVMALAVAIAGSTPSIRAALRMDPAAVLRVDA